MDDWSVSVPVPEPFANKEIVIPFQDKVTHQNCSACNGSGKRDCFICDMGRQRCPNCSGSGRYVGYGSSTRCSLCYGQGHVKCRTCSGSGKQLCTVCKGVGTLCICESVETCCIC